MPRLTDEQKRDNQVGRVYERYMTWSLARCKKDALKEFQLLRRLECAKSSPRGFDTHRVECICISCSRIKPYNEMDAGHFISRRKTAVAFSRNNVWPQCVHCNQHLNGNQVEYRKRLIYKIGLDEVLLLEAWQDVSVDLDKYTLAQARECYRALQKVEKARLGL